MPEIIDRRISFNAGELSPWLDPRIDLDKYRAGCRTLKNMLPAIYGGALRRPGTAYLGSAPGAGGQVRLVPFVASASTSYILEFSDLALRIWTTGGTPALVGAPLVVVTPYAAADLNALQFAQQNDVLFISHPSYAPRELSRYSATDWRLGNLQVFWPATLEENVSDTTIAVSSVSAGSSVWNSGTSYTTIGTKVTSGGKAWALKEACLNVPPGSGPLAQRHWMETLEVPAYSAAVTYALDALVYNGSKTWKSLVAGNIAHTPAVGAYWQEVGAPIGMVVTLTASAAAFVAIDVGRMWVVSQKREDLKVDFAGPWVLGTLASPIQVLGEWSAAVTAAAVGSNEWEANFLVQRSLDNINWETRNVVSSRYGDVQKLITGFEKDVCFLRVKLGPITNIAYAPSSLKCSIEVGAPTSPAIFQITGFTSTTVVTAMVIFPQSGLFTATKYWNSGAWSASTGYPRALTLHQGRLFFAGTASKPTTFWGSSVDGYQDFRVAAADDSAVAYTLNSDESSGVEWLVSQDTLLIGTASGEWVFGSRAGETEEKLRRNTSYGSLPVQARTIADALVFIQRSGRKLREFAWSFDRDGYQSVDLSMLAEHIGDSVFVQIAIQRNPEPIIWVVTVAGELLSLVYERSQKVAAWARHTTDGTFESVAIVPGAGEDDQIWVSVLRPGNGTIRFIERFKSDTVRMLKTGNLTSLVYVDSSKTSVSSGSGLVSGLAHLIGKSVSLLVDGKVHPPATVVSGGTVQLQANAANYTKTVVAGLPYDSVLEPTYLETMDPNSVSLAGKKRLHRVIMEFWKSGPVSVSTDGGATYQPITFASGVSLMTGPLEMYLEGSSDRQVTAIFKQSNPLPFNLMGLLLRYNVEMA